MRPRISRCICHNRSFEEIKEYAGRHDIRTVEELQARDICSRGCGLCIPYVEMIFETGDTEFEPGAYYRRK